MSPAVDSWPLFEVLVRTAEVFELRADVAKARARRFEKLGQPDQAADARGVVERARDTAQRARSEAARLEQRRRELDERERRADERDRVADERERAADAREQVADRRERAADEVETRLYKRIVPRSSGLEPGPAASMSPAVDSRRLL